MTIALPRRLLVHLHGLDDGVGVVDELGVAVVQDEVEVEEELAAAGGTQEVGGIEGEVSQGLQGGQGRGGGGGVQLDGRGDACVGL